MSEETATTAPDDSRTISDYPAHSEPRSAPGDANYVANPPTQDPAILEELPTVLPAKAEVTVTDTAAKPHRTGPTLKECVTRLEDHITYSKPDLGKKLFQGDIHEYGSMAETMISSLIDLGCDSRLAKEFSVLTLYDLVVFIGISLPRHLVCAL